MKPKISLTLIFVIIFSQNIIAQETDVVREYSTEKISQKAEQTPKKPNKSFVVGVLRASIPYQYSELQFTEQTPFGNHHKTHRPYFNFQYETTKRFTWGIESSFGVMNKEIQEWGPSINRSTSLDKRSFISIAPTFGYIWLKRKKFNFQAQIQVPFAYEYRYKKEISNPNTNTVTYTGTYNDFYNGFGVKNQFEYYINHKYSAQFNLGTFNLSPIYPKTYYTFENNYLSVGIAKRF